MMKIRELASPQLVGKFAGYPNLCFPLVSLIYPSGKLYPAKFTLLVWLTLVWFFLATNWAKAQSKNALIKRIPPETISAWLLENQVPAVGIGIIEKGILQDVKVYGKQNNRLLPVNTIFNVASLTKPVVAMLTLVLVSRKQWQLDEPLAKYWVDPQVQADPFHQQLTTRHILSQQSGFTNWRWNHASQKLTFDVKPGTKFGYSGEGFEYLKRALEAKFRRPLEQLADSILFQPLKMNNTRFYWPERVDTSQFAFEYDAQGKRYEIPPRRDASAADDLLTTVEDYSTFSVSVLKRTGLTKQVFREMSKPQTLVDSDKKLFWGLGWELVQDLSKGEYALYHGGSDRGVRTAVILLPKSSRGLILFTNGDKGGAVIRRMAAESLDVGKEIIERLK